MISRGPVLVFPTIPQARQNCSLHRMNSSSIHGGLKCTITVIIKFSTSDNAFHVLWLVQLILVISSYSHISLTLYRKWLHVAKLKKNKLFCGKFGSMPTFRSTQKGKKCFFVLNLRLSGHKVLHNIASSSSLFRFHSDFLAFSLLFHTSNFWCLRNLIKLLFHSRLLDMRLVIANSALRTSLAIYHLISNARSWNTC